MSDLSILCVTRGDARALPFIQRMNDLQRELEAEMVLAVDGGEQTSMSNGVKHVYVRSAGYLESVLDRAVEHCANSYVLRLDDDETCSRGMVDWLARREYEAGQHWKFPRAHLWGDEHHMLKTPHLWPDHQTRLSWKKFSGNRKEVHAGSPHGGGVPAPCALEHHKFLIRSLEERREMVKRYDSIQAGAGTNFRVFSCPEDVYSPDMLALATQPWDGRTVTQ